MSDQIIVMDGGLIAQSGTPQELYEYRRRSLSPVSWASHVVPGLRRCQRHGVARPTCGITPRQAMRWKVPLGGSAARGLAHRPARRRAGARLAKAAYLGSNYEYTFETELGAILWCRPISPMCRNQAPMWPEPGRPWRLGGGPRGLNARAGCGPAGVSAMAATRAWRACAPRSPRQSRQPPAQSQCSLDASLRRAGTRQQPEILAVRRAHQRDLVVPIELDPSSRPRPMAPRPASRVRSAPPACPRQAGPAPAPCGPAAHQSPNRPGPKRSGWARSPARRRPAVRRWPPPGRCSCAGTSWAGWACSYQVPWHSAEGPPGRRRAAQAGLQPRGQRRGEGAGGRGGPGWGAGRSWP